MTRVGIITICDPIPNYGNRLQNYAVQIYLKKMGCEVVTYNFEGYEIKLKDRLKHFFHKLTNYRFTKDKFLWTYGFEKRKVFKEFNRKYIRMKYRNSISKGLHKEQDFFVLGSDQVWNTNWFGNNSVKKEAFLLSFAPPEKKVFFSPSFGFSKLPPEWHDWFRINLQNVEHLSVREEAGAQIIYELLGIRPAVLIDPTMMLTPDEWLKISCRPTDMPSTNRYLFSYFIGNKSSNTKEVISDLCSERDLELYSLLERNEPSHYVYGPSEFIYLIAHSELVVTDSFHACVFSILFNKPFIVFARSGKESDLMSRIDSLLEKFDLQHHKYKGTINSNMFEHDYSHAAQYLDEERKKVNLFLSQSFHL